MERRPRVIKLKENPFEEQELTHQTLLHVHFTDNYENAFRWTPKWTEVEAIFYKGIEIEERNNPEGVWSEELKRTAEKFPKIKEFKLPVQIKYSGLEETDGEKWRYKVDISILPLSGEEWVNVEGSKHGGGFQIGSCCFRMQFLGKILKKMRPKYAIGWSEQCTTIYDELPSPNPAGISFSLRFPGGLERTDYQILCRQIAAAIRHYIRSVILDSKSIQEGLEEIN